MSVLLALDSSTEHMALALVGQGHAAFLDADGGAQASQRLIPEAMALLRADGVSLAQIDAIGFGRGPGAFTGLRTACSVAQGLAFGADKPVLALDSLMLVAEDARLQLAASGGASSAGWSAGPDPATQTLTGPVRDVWVAMDARMNQIYAGHYRWGGDHWQTLTPPMLIDPEPLQALWRVTPAAVVAGSALEAFGLDAGPSLRLATTLSRARALGSLALQAWARGQAEPADAALPLYVRDKVALTTAERAQPAPGGRA